MRIDPANAQAHAKRQAAATTACRFDSVINAKEIGGADAGNSVGAVSPPDANAMRAIPVQRRPFEQKTTKM